MLAWGGLTMQAYCLHVKKGIVISTSHLLSECQVSEHITIAWTVNSVNRLVKRSKHLKDSSFHPSLTYTHASQASSSRGFRNLERGVQPLPHEAHPKILEVPRPLPVT